MMIQKENAPYWRTTHSKRANPSSMLSKEDKTIIAQFEVKAKRRVRVTLRRTRANEILVLLVFLAALIALYAVLCAVLGVDDINIYRG